MAVVARRQVVTGPPGRSDLSDLVPCHGTLIATQDAPLRMDSGRVVRFCFQCSYATKNRQNLRSCPQQPPLRRPKLRKSPSPSRNRGTAQEKVRYIEPYAGCSCGRARPSLPCRPEMAYRDPTAWLGMKDSNSEMSSQIIPLKGRIDLRESSRILALETVRV
jgi:hypothetical protein